MERLKAIKENLISQVQNQMSHLECVDTEELGEVVDMLKDIEEALYYNSITTAMEDATKKEAALMRYYPINDKRHSNRDMLERRRYDAGEMMYYSDSYDEYLNHIGNAKETYYRNKAQKSNDKTAQINSLEKYLQKLASDVAEIIEDCSPEEKTLIHKKLVGLAAKVE